MPILNSRVTATLDRLAVVAAGYQVGQAVLYFFG